MEEKCKYGENINLLNQYEFNVLVFIEFFEETMNGGFVQFIENSSGDRFNDLERVLTDINANKILDIYSEVLKLIPILPTDRDERYEVTEAVITEDIFNKLNECDKKLFKISQEYFENIVFEYIDNNRKHFI